MIERRKTRKIRIGDIAIGGDAPVTVQSMTSTRTEDTAATIGQIRRLVDAGCEIVRVAVPNREAAEALGVIRRSVRIPLVADIHFQYQLALTALKQGVDKIRINPGNIGDEDRIHKVLRAAKERGVPIRIGVNAGSLSRENIQKHAGITAEGMVNSALDHVRICEDSGFSELVISLKSSNVPLMIEANRLLSNRADYPIHLGVTEAGTPGLGILRSAAGIGALLADGIGDTLRISLTGDPVEEVRAGFEILKTMHLRTRGVTLISCPTCGRLETNLVPLVEAVEKALAGVTTPVTVAMMGCAVNGPGEAREADIGIACGKHEALLFRKGKSVRKLREEEIVPVIVEEVRKWKG